MFTPAAITTMAAATATMAAATATMPAATATMPAATAAFTAVRAHACATMGCGLFPAKRPAVLLKRVLLTNVCGIWAFCRLCVACAHVCGMARCKLNNSPMKDRFE